MIWQRLHIWFPISLLATFLALGLKAQPVIAINEICAVNNSIAADPSGQFDDWVELYNNTGATINLGEYFLSDDHSNPTKWMFPEATMIPANGYLIVWCDNDTFQAGVHAFFKLSSAGEQVIISTPTGDMIDSITFGAQLGDTTFGRYPNGFGSFVTMLPSHSATNSPGLVATDGPLAISLLVYPNPASEYFRVELPVGFQGEISLRHISGQVLARRKASQTSLIEWDTHSLPNGMYLLEGEGIPTTSILVHR